MDANAIQLIPGKYFKMWIMVVFSSTTRFWREESCAKLEPFVSKSSQNFLIASKTNHQRKQTDTRSHTHILIYTLHEQESLQKTRLMFFNKQNNKTKMVNQQTQINFEEQWKYLQSGIDRLIDFLDSNTKRPFDHKEYTNMYSTVYNLCTQKVDTGKQPGGATELLYERYKKSIIQYLTDSVVPSLKEKQGEVLLMEAVKRWRNHQTVVKYMCKLFKYLDMYYTKHNNRDNLRDVGIKCYQTHVYESIKKDVSVALLDKIHKERTGETIDRSMMKDGINLFIEMGLNTLNAYEKDFESPLLFETSSFYKRESAQWINQDSVPDYMKKTEDRLEQELARAQAYLHNSTETNLIKKIETELITAHQDRLLENENSGFIKLLKDYKVEDLSRMYRLFKRVNNLKRMSEMMRDYVKDEGMALVQSYQEQPELDTTAYIDSLLNLHEKYSQLVNVQFEKDNLFLEALKDAFTAFVNADLVHTPKDATAPIKSSTSELLSTYCDTIMKSTDKVGEEKLDELLEKIVRLFGYISDKDMFQEFYRRQLSKRLLVAKSNTDAERSLISKLKMRQGASFTSKLEGMIKDQSLSDDLQKEFEKYCENKKKELPISFSPQVLTTGFWPSFKIDQLTINDEFNTCLTIFKEFYDSRTESRTLKWVHSLGTCNVLGRFPAGEKDLIMSTYQACILVLFNSQEEITAGDIQKTLTLPFDDIKKNLLSLSVSKAAQILKKDGPNPKKIETNDVFSVNTEFSNKNRRIKIPNLVLKITDKERDEIDANTKEDRKHAIEAAIVRLMKARKQMQHQELVLETSKQLMAHFRPDPKVIKQRIEDLISREYLERDPNQTNTYRYLA
jgi:cullin 1